MCREVSADGHDGEVQAVEVISEVEHAGKAGAGEFGFDPGAGGIAIGVPHRIVCIGFIELSSRQPVDGPLEIGIIAAEDLLQDHRRPRGL